MDLVKYDVHFGFKNDEISVKELLEKVENGTFINHIEYGEDILLESTIYKLVNKVPIHIVCIKDNEDSNKFRIIKGSKDVENILKFKNSSETVKIGKREISFEKNKGYLLELSFVNISYICLEEIVLMDEYIEIIESLLEIL